MAWWKRSSETETQRDKAGNHFKQTERMSRMLRTPPTNVRTRETERGKNCRVTSRRALMWNNKMATKKWSGDRSLYQVIDRKTHLCGSERGTAQQKEALKLESFLQSHTHACSHTWGTLILDDCSFNSAACHSPNSHLDFRISRQATLHSTQWIIQQAAAATSQTNCSL